MNPDQTACISSLSPLDGKPVGSVPVTPIDTLPEIFQAAREAQGKWAAVSVRRRAQSLLDIRETLINHVDDLADLIHRENGKPRFECLSNDLYPCVELLTYFGKNAPRILKNKKLKISNPLLLHRESYLQYWPKGVVAIISPWNFPFMLPFAEIVMAIAAGNAVVFKPSEVTPVIGSKIQEICEEAGIPVGLIQTVQGDGKLGAAMIDQKPSKIFFTGSPATGRKVLAQASQHLIPVCLELGGKDAMIVLPDADLDYATSAALWGGFANSGQVCASTERLIVHENIYGEFVTLLKEKVEQLRQLPTSEETDLGAITYPHQKKIYQDQLEQAKSKGARILTGGEFVENQTALQPTLVTGDTIEELDIYQQETFGPVIAITKFKSISEAVKKANQSDYGLLASVITKNIALGEEVARQLEVGTVTINEVTYTSGIPEAPWGGVKNTGYGVKHSDTGLLEFVHTRHIHKPRRSVFTFKSSWWFPYTPHQFATFRRLFEFYRRSKLRRLKAVPLFLWNFLRFLKREPRL